VRVSTHRVKIVAPTWIDYAEARCKSEPVDGAIRRPGENGGIEGLARSPGNGVSFFVFLTGPDGVPLANVAISEAVTSTRIPAVYKSTERISGKTDAGGRYFSCWNYQIDETVQIWIRQAGKAPQLTLQHLTQKIEAVRIVASAQTVANKDAAPVTVRGTVFDSLNNRPLANATVRVSGLDGSVTTDSVGAFAIPGIASGYYTVSAQHADLDTLGFGELAADLDISSTKSAVSLSIPSFGTLWASGCSSRAAPKDSGFIFGNIRDANTRDVLSDVRVQVSWSEVRIGANNKLAQTKRTLESKSDTFGGYVVCGIPIDVALDVIATIDAATTTTLALGARGARVQRQDISLVVPESGSSEATGGTRTGTVKGIITSTSGEPVGNVRVSVGGIVRARSDSLGNFVITRVPVGTRPVEFVAIGMSPVTQNVDVVEGQTVDVSLKLDRITVLEKVEVKGMRQTQILREFDERKRSGFGHIEDSTFIDKVGTLGSVMRSFPAIIPGGQGLEPPIYFRKAVGPGGMCEANYFVDRFRVDKDAFYLVRPTEVAWIETYPRRLTVPPEFMGGRECGVVALFTKRSIAK